MWESEWETVIVGCCICPCISYITSDLIFPHGHNHLSLPSATQPAKQSSTQALNTDSSIMTLTHTHWHARRHTHSLPASTCYPHTLIPNPPRSIKKFQVTKLWRWGRSWCILLFPLAEDYPGWQGERTCIRCGQLLRVRYGWVNNRSAHRNTHVPHKHMLPRSALHFTDPSPRVFILSPLMDNAGLLEQVCLIVLTLDITQSCWALLT